MRPRQGDASELENRKDGSSSQLHKGGNGGREQVGKEVDLPLLSVVLSLQMTATLGEKDRRWQPCHIC